MSILLKMFSSVKDIKNREILLKWVVRVCDIYFCALDMRSNNAKLGVSYLELQKNANKYRFPFFGRQHTNRKLNCKINS